MFASPHSAPSLHDLLAPLLATDPGWKVAETESGGGTATLVWPDDTADSLVVINTHVALFRRETGNGRGIGNLLEGTARDVVDTVLRLPPPSTVGVVIEQTSTSGMEAADE